MPHADTLDAYAHVSLPRFCSPEDMLAVMDAYGVGKALISTARTCPDLKTLSDAIAQYPDRFRAVGLPIGRGIDELRRSIFEQLDRGFDGVRMPDSLIASQPEVLDEFAKFDCLIVLVGREGLLSASSLLADFLDANPGCRVLAADFAGPTRPAIFDEVPSVRRLFQHERFGVIFSNHGAIDADVLIPWARAVVDLVGWDRLLYGSGFPVSLWRNESYASTWEWIERHLSAATEADKHKLFCENAERMIFASERRRVRPLPRDLQRPKPQPKRSPVRLLSETGLELPEKAHYRLLQGYLRREGKPITYAEYLAKLLMKASGRLDV
ncbi:MAG: amidohydrolase family protein [Phycisphaerae bacterium]